METTERWTYSVTLPRSGRAGLKLKQLSSKAYTVTHRAVVPSYLSTERILFFFFRASSEMFGDKSICSYFHNLYFFLLLRMFKTWRPYRLLLYTLGQKMVRGKGFCAAGDGQEIERSCSITATQSASRQRPRAWGSVLGAWGKVNNTNRVVPLDSTGKDRQETLKCKVNTVVLESEKSSKENKTFETGGVGSFRNVS